MNDPFYQQPQVEILIEVDKREQLKTMRSSDEAPSTSCSRERFGHAFWRFRKRSSSFIIISTLLITFAQF